jgi:hypothetical protein
MYVHSDDILSDGLTKPLKIMAKFNAWKDTILGVPH